MHAKVERPPIEVIEHTVPFEQFASEQHVSTHTPPVHTPDRQSAAVPQLTPDTPGPSVDPRPIAEGDTQ